MIESFFGKMTKQMLRDIRVNSKQELVDNTFGHECYIMTTEDNKVWSVKVLTFAYNITFNRYNQDKSILWNSWSEGGRDGKVTYVAEGNYNGYWTE